MNNDKHQIAAGMTASVEAEVFSKNPMILIPAKAVYTFKGKESVWIYNPSNSKVNRRSIESGELVENDKIQITSGLNADEFVVTAGVNSLTEGEIVKVVQQVSATNVGGLL